MTASSGIYPRSVTPGIENQQPEPSLPEPGIYIGLDWIRCTGDENRVDAVCELLTELFGDSDKPSNGAKWFKHGREWQQGVLLSWGHSKNLCQVDIQGACLSMMPGDERIDALRRFIELGMKATRIDGAIDWIGQNVEVWSNAKRSTEAGELCILRSYGNADEFQANGQQTRRHLKVGKRTSAVCARIYDKGLQTGLAEAGHWERDEVEWKKDRAMQIAEALLAAGSEWPSCLASLIFGAVDFRRRNGRTELTRRKRCRWWARLIGSTAPMRVSPTAIDRSFEQYVDWLRSSVAPRLNALSAEVGIPIEQVVRFLTEGTRVGEARRADAEHFMAMYGEDRPTFEPDGASRAVLAVV